MSGIVDDDDDDVGFSASVVVELGLFEARAEVRVGSVSWVGSSCDWYYTRE